MNRITIKCWPLVAAMLSTLQAEESVKFNMSLKDAKAYHQQEDSWIRTMCGDKLGPYAPVGGVTVNGDALKRVQTGRSYTSGIRDPDALFHLEFFLNERGKPLAIVHQESLPEQEVTEPEPEPEDERPYVQQALSDAASFAVAQGNVALLEALMKAGLSPDLPIDVDTSWTALHYAAIHNEVEVARLLRNNGADLGIRTKWGERAVDIAFEKNRLDFCEVVARPDGDERMIEDIPENLLRELLRDAGSEKVCFISLNGQDPPERLLDFFRRYWPNVRPRSRAMQVDRGDNPSSYQDRKTKDFGRIVEISLKGLEAGSFSWSIRQATGPALAGGGAGGNISKKFGYWIRHDSHSWDE